MNYEFSPEVLSDTIGSIYDCAVDPEQWDTALQMIRDRMGLSFVQVLHQDYRHQAQGLPPLQRAIRTTWDDHWIDLLPTLMHKVPKIEVWMDAEIDTPISQMQLVEEADFRECEFCRAWVEPQGLRDTCNAPILRRDGQVAWLVAVSPQGRKLFDEHDRRLLGMLTPHVRRAFLISDLVTEKNRQLQLYRDMLDGVGTAVFLLGPDARLMYHNAAAEVVLTQTSCLGVRDGRIHPQSRERQAAFAEAVARACTTDELSLGYWGNGMPLPGKANEAAVAYLLPLTTSEYRHALGPGLAALFVTTATSSQPPSIEVLSALSGLTTAESRIALAIADGEATESIASRLEISIHTLRKHLSNTFDKTGQSTQVALGAYVNRLRF